MPLMEVNRDLWLLMLREGGMWTAADVQRRMGWSLNETINRLHCLHRQRVVERYEPTADQRRLRYAVTGLCKVPSGMKLAEVQV